MAGNDKFPDMIYVHSADGNYPDEIQVTAANAQASVQQPEPAQNQENDQK